MPLSAPTCRYALALCSLCPMLATPVLAEQGAQRPDRLLSVSEWNSVCAAAGSEERTARCRRAVVRPVAYGRLLGPFELRSPGDPNLLQTRSGVLFDADLNNRVDHVAEDAGLRTRLVLQDDVQCQAYATLPDLVGIPGPERNYRGLVSAWLQTYTEAESRLRNLGLVRENGRPGLRFDALMAGGRIIRGLYSFDREANAGIFTTCDHPLASETAERTASLFFGAIAGSARRFF